MNIHFFFKTIPIMFFFLINIFFSRLVLCENNTDIKNTVIAEDKNLKLSDMLTNVMPSVVRVITSYHNFDGKYCNDALQTNKINNSFDIDQNTFKYKNYFNINKLPTIYKKYILNNTNNNKLGSGVIIDSKNAYVLTNYHVINQANKINVYLTNGKVYRALLVGRCKKMDLALLKLHNADNLQSINIADYKNVHVGDYAIAIGSPYNLKNSVSFGIISALKRVNHELNLYDDFIQTDAAINHGNSGGPLVNTKGELIGINTSILSNAEDDGNIGIGFSIPTNTILRFVKQVKKNGEYHAGQLGILATKLNKSVIDELKLPMHQGILVNLVKEHSSAKKCNIYPGDIITSIDGRKFHNIFSLKHILKDFAEGDVVLLRVFRNGKYFDKTVELKYHLSPIKYAAKFHYKLAGVLVKEYNSKKIEQDLKDNIDYDDEDEIFIPDTNGIIIKHINRDSFARRFGLHKNDLIISVNNKQVTDIDSFKEALSIHKNVIVLEIIRDKCQFVHMIY